MKQDQAAVVIGAGPYGLSVTAHLQAKGIPTQVFGKPMEFWRKMPPAMYLKSSWSALGISDPAGSNVHPPGHPIPLLTTTDTDIHGDTI